MVMELDELKTGPLVEIKKLQPDVELPSGDTHHVSRYATPAVTTNRTYFAPFILEQMGRQAYDADGEPMPGLSDLLERLECWAEGGCCGTGSSVRKA